MIKITTNGASPAGVVVSQDGVAIDGIRAIKITMLPDDIVRATIEVLVDHVDVEVLEILSMASLESAALHYGMKLVKDD